MRAQLTRLRLEALEARLVLSTYYVDPTGSDGNNGSNQHPWATLQHASDSVGPGDTVDVRTGNYAGFDVTTSGEPGRPIVFQAQGSVTILYPESIRGRDGINIENFSSISYITIDGFQIYNMPDAGIRVVGDSDTHSVGVVLRNNIVDSNGNQGIFTAYTDNLLIENNYAGHSLNQHGIYVSNSSQAPVIRGNYVSGDRVSGIQINADGSEGAPGITRNALIEKNTLVENGWGGGAAINLDGVQDSVVQNNLLANNHASGIALFRQDGARGSSRNVVADNTVVMAADARWALTISGGSVQNKIVNNILYNQHSFHGSLSVALDSLRGLVSNYNVVMNRFTTDDGDSLLDLNLWQLLTGQDRNSIVATPDELFVDWQGDDYHLSDFSPAIGEGTSQYAPADDLEGNPRPSPSGWSIGAFEYMDASSHPGIPGRDLASGRDQDRAALAVAVGVVQRTLDGWFAHHQESVF